VLPYSAAHNASTYGDEFDTTIITFNTAVILYHLHDYESALTVLDPLYRNIEPIDETTALHLCFLLLDITLALQDASKAAVSFVLCVVCSNHLKPLDLANFFPQAFLISMLP